MHVGTVDLSGLTRDQATAKLERVVRLARRGPADADSCPTARRPSATPASAESSMSMRSLRRHWRSAGPVIPSSESPTRSGLQSAVRRSRRWSPSTRLPSVRALPRSRPMSPVRPVNATIQAGTSGFTGTTSSVGRSLVDRGADPPGHGRPGGAGRARPADDRHLGRPGRGDAPVQLRPARPRPRRSQRRRRPDRAQPRQRLLDDPGRDRRLMARRDRQARRDLRRRGRSGQGLGDPHGALCKDQSKGRQCHLPRQPEQQGRRRGPGR